MKGHREVTLPIISSLTGLISLHTLFISRHNHQGVLIFRMSIQSSLMSQGSPVDKENVPTVKTLCIYSQVLRKEHGGGSNKSFGNYDSLTDDERTGEVIGKLYLQ